MEEMHRIRKFSLDATVHSFDSQEWGEGKLEEIFLQISLPRQNIQENKNLLRPHSLNPMHKERGKFCTCHPFPFLFLSYSFDISIL